MKHTVIARTAVALAASLVLAACGLSEDSGTTTDTSAGEKVEEGALKGVSLNVGSKDFDEQFVLGELAIQTLAAAGAEVTDKTNIKGSTAAREALLRGDVDVYYDYTGTGYINYLGHGKSIPDEQKLYEAVKEEDLKKNGLVWGEPAPFNNTYAFATTKEFAEENSLKTLSDMKTYLDENSDATVCVETEFANRPDGLPGMQKAYDMDIPSSSIKSLGTGVIYPQIDKGTCDFGEVFTTDGRIANLGLIPLEDDKKFFPLYNGAPIVEKGNENGDKILEVLAPLTETLTTEVMTELNKQISADGLPVDKIAGDYLKKQGFIQ